MIPGNKITQADAIRAYCQALLKSKDPTWVTIHPLLRRKDMKEPRPCCRLLKALYGHPESGAHGEKHLTDAILMCGGVPIINHPSSFWIKPLSIMLTVYVDDLLCSGPVASHAKFWKCLRNSVLVVSILTTLNLWTVFLDANMWYFRAPQRDMGLVD